MADLPDSLGTYLSSLPELRDPNRRRALYGALPLKSVNEGAYRDRVVFWKSAISGALQKGFFGPRTVLAVTRELPQRLQSCEGIIPKCIPGVLNQLVQDSKLIELDTFFNVRGSGGLWIRGLVSPFRWLWSIARPYEDESVPSELPVGQFVDMDGVEALLKSVVQSHRKTEDGNALAIYSLDGFKELFGNGCDGTERNPIADIDLATVLHMLHVRGMVSVDGIKFGRDGVWATDGTGAIKFVVGEDRTITDVDKSVLRIRSTVAKLQKQAFSLQNRSFALDVEIKDKLATKQKPRALVLLKQRMSVQGLLAKCDESLSLLESVLHKIDQARQDSEVLAAIEGGSKALKTMVGPAQTDKAHRILEEWDEALADQEELNSALQAPAEALEEVEVEALEAELEDLLMAEKAVSAERNDERESLELDLAKLSIKDPETVGEQSGEKVQDVSGLAPQNATAEVKVAELV